MKRIDIVGTKYFHIFRDGNGKLFEVEITENEYRQPRYDPWPTHPNGTYIGESYARHKVDTPTGDLSYGEYCDEGETILTVDNNGYLTALNKERSFDSNTESMKDDTILAKERPADDWPQKQEWAKPEIT